MLKFIRGRVDSFNPAFDGLRHVLRSQPNTWIHSIVSVAVIAIGFWVGLDLGAWAIIVLAMGMVWVAELTNSAIEAAVDLASPNHHSLAKIAKDVSAAAVVISVLAAVIVGLLVLGPSLWMRISFIISPK